MLYSEIKEKKCQAIMKLGRDREKDGAQSSRHCPLFINSGVIVRICDAKTNLVTASQVRCIDFTRTRDMR